MTTTPPWLLSFRELAPHLSTPGLRALAGALEADDPTLIQGEVCSDMWGEGDRLDAPAAESVPADLLEAILTARRTQR